MLTRGKVVPEYKEPARELSGARCLRPLAVVLLAYTAVCGVQTPAEAQASLRTDAANEPMQMGAPAERDADAARDAQTGWYANALPTRDKRLQWWREARFGCFIHWGP